MAMRSAYEQRLRLQQNKMKIQSNLNIKANQREPENVFFFSSCPLNTDLHYMHYSLMDGENETALYRQ